MYKALFRQKFVVVAALGAVSLLLGVVAYQQKVDAAENGLECYAETSTLFQVFKLESCPGITASTSYVGSDGQIMATKPTSGCFVRRTATVPGGGSAFVFQQNQCDIVKVFYDEYQKARCNQSGGNWTNAEGVASLVCMCETGYKLNSSLACEKDSIGGSFGSDGVLKDTSGTGIRGGECEGTIDSCLQSTRFVQILTSGLNFLTGVAGIAIVGSIIFGAIQYASSGGDPKKASEAKNRIYNAMIALLGLLLLFSFLQWIIPGGAFN